MTFSWRCLLANDVVSARRLVAGVNAGPTPYARFADLDGRVTVGHVRNRTAPWNACVGSSRVLARFLLMVSSSMSTKSEVPWVYLCLKVQYAWPQAGARLALGLPHAWPANGRDEPRAPAVPGGLVLAALESAVGGLP